MKAELDYSYEQEKYVQGLQDFKNLIQKIPNVLAIGIGLKESNNEITESISFRVFVSRKIPETVLNENELIPKEFNGLITDVLIPYKIKRRIEVCGEEREKVKKYSRLKGGIPISNRNEGSIYGGTLGWFGILDADDSYVGLTNNHVLYSNVGVNTDTVNVCQPKYNEPSRCCCCECGSTNIIGSTMLGVENDLVDVGLFRISESVASNIEFIISNDSSTETLQITGDPVISQAISGHEVRKIGARSGFTKGIIIHIGDTAIEGTDPAGNEIEIIPDQVLIIPHSTETYQIKDSNTGVCKFAFSADGDSGSVVVNSANQIVALLYAGDDINNSVDVTFANNISNVLSTVSNNGFPLRLASSSSGAGRKRHMNLAGKVSSHTSEDGRLFLQQINEINQESTLNNLVNSHDREILALINHARPVMLAWQRHQGPAFVAAIARAAREEHYRIPEEINGVNRTQLLLAMKEALILSGSTALQQDIVRYESVILQSVTRGDTIRALAEHLLAAGLIDRIPSHVSPAIA